MVVTRTELLRRALRRIGARTGSISSGTGTTAILSGLINTTGDDGLFKNGLLWMLEATNETDREKTVELWEDLTGTAHFADRSDETYSNETYILQKYPGYTLTEARDAGNVALREMRRTYRYVYPLHSGQLLIPLPQLTWLIGADDIDAVWSSHSPNTLHNEDFGLWDNGDAAVPDGWTMAGTDATVARVTGGIRSAYAVTLARTGADATLYQSIPAPFLQYHTRSSSATLPTVLGRAWVTCSTASRARIGIYNGSSTTYSSYHSGTDDLPEFLTVSYDTAATDTELRLVLSVDTGDASANFHWAGLVPLDDFPTALRDYGSAGYEEHELAYVRRNVGGVPAVELREDAHGQLIIYTRRPFPAMDDDADEIDDQYARALEAGLLTNLLEIRKPNQDRTRLDVILDGDPADPRDFGVRGEWTRLTKNFVSLPVPKPLRAATVRSA